MAGVARFDCYPSDFLNGLIGLTADQIAVYTVFILLQYDRGEAVQVDGRERELAVRAGLSRGRLRSALCELVCLGKLQSNGVAYWDKRSKDELEKIRQRISKNAQNSEKGGEATRQKFEAIRNENSEAIGPTGQPIGQPKTGPIFSAIRISASEEVKSETSSDAPHKTAVAVKEKRTRQSYPADFERFWSGYPTDQNMSKKEALEAWSRISDEDRTAAIASLPGFHAFCRKDPTYRPIHANRYLSKGRFEGHLSMSKKIAERVFIAKDSPQWRSWQHAEGKTFPTRRDAQTGVDGWDFPSEWPPPKGAAA